MVLNTTTMPAKICIFKTEQLTEEGTGRLEIPSKNLSFFLYDIPPLALRFLL
jgi:hypothetical protein